MVMEMEKNFSCGKRIRELRKQRALSQEQLALSAGITPVYLGQVERGQKNATVNTIELICAALNISLANFFTVADGFSAVDDDIGKQILHQLTGLTDAEKSAVLQLVKQALQLRKISLQCNPQDDKK